MRLSKRGQQLVPDPGTGALREDADKKEDTDRGSSISTQELVQEHRPFKKEKMQLRIDDPACVGTEWHPASETEQWNVCCRIKHKMSLSSAIAATMNGEPMSPEGTQEGNRPAV